MGYSVKKTYVCINITMAVLLLQIVLPLDSKMLDKGELVRSFLVFECVHLRDTEMFPVCL